MKTLSESEIKKYLIEYFAKKDIYLTIERGRLVWYYKSHYSNFTVTIYPEKQDNNYPFSIKLYSHYPIKNLRRRRTIAKGSFGLSVYKNLQFVKSEFDKIAEDDKLKRDTKSRYCTELESYYKKIHNKVDITANRYGESPCISISVMGYDDNGKSTYYSITYEDNKYYLNYKTENYEKVKDLENLL